MNRVFLAAMLGTILLFSPRFAHAQTSRPAYPDSVDGVGQLFKDILTASASHNEAALVTLTRSLQMPEYKQWFKSVFPEDVAPRMIEEFEKNTLTTPPKLAILFASLKDPAKLTIEITRVEAADDPAARIYQRLAIEAMVNPAPLYSVTISLPQSSAKIEIWSLVYSGGGFRLIGKMQAIRG